jgi:hypothetical protein
MIDSKIAQQAAAVPPSDKGKILGQPEDLETGNLVNIHNELITILNHQKLSGLIIHFLTRKVIQGGLSFLSP